VAALLAIVVATAEGRPSTPQVLYLHRDRAGPDATVSLRTMTPDGSKDTWLADYPDALEPGPDWSPDGTQILIPTGTNALAILRSDGTKAAAENLPELLFPREPEWSPDGAQALFFAYTARRPHVYVVDLRTHVLRDLTAGLGRGDLPWDEHPDWSPDGAHIVFDSPRDQEFWWRQPDDPLGAAMTADLHVMTSDGAHIANLTESMDHEFYPAWSPDGRSIAFVRQAGGENPSVVTVLDMATGREQQLTDEGLWAFHPSWSPDGRRILFTGIDARNVANGRNIYVVSADGGGVTQLTDYVGEPALYPKWFDPALGLSPAGRLPTNWGGLKW